MFHWTQTGLLKVEKTIAADNALKELLTYKPVTSNVHPVTLFFDSSPAQLNAVYTLLKLDKRGILRFGSKNGPTFSAVANKFPSVCAPAHIDSLAVIARDSEGFEQSFAKTAAVPKILKLLPGSLTIRFVATRLPDWIMDSFYLKILKGWEKKSAPEEGFNIPEDRYLE